MKNLRRSVACFFRVLRLDLFRRGRVLLEVHLDAAAQPGIPRQVPAQCTTLHAVGRDAFRGSISRFNRIGASVKCKNVSRTGWFHSGRRFCPVADAVEADSPLYSRRRLWVRRRRASRARPRRLKPRHWIERRSLELALAQGPWHIISL